MFIYLEIFIAIFHSLLDFSFPVLTLISEFCELAYIGAAVQLNAPNLGWTLCYEITKITFCLWILATCAATNLKVAHRLTGHCWVVAGFHL